MDSNSHNNNTPIAEFIAILHLIARFDLGSVVFTRNLTETIKPSEALRGLTRHAMGDWGDVCEEDWLENQHGLENGLRLMSVYTTADGVKFWIITEWDRSYTTILLPDDY